MRNEPMITLRAIRAMDPCESGECYLHYQLTRRNAGMRVDPRGEAVCDGLGQLRYWSEHRMGKAWPNNRPFPIEWIREKNGEADLEWLLLRIRQTKGRHVPKALYTRVLSYWSKVRSYKRRGASSDVLNALDRRFTLGQAL